MAKMHGPLMSLNAAGTIAGSVTYRTTNGKQVAQAQTIRRAPATQAQANSRAGYADAAAYWRTIDTPTKDRWKAKAALLSLPPFAAYAQEWTRQQSTTENPPILPA